MSTVYSALCTVLCFQEINNRGLEIKNEFLDPFSMPKKKLSFQSNGESLSPYLSYASVISKGDMLRV